VAAYRILADKNPKERTMTALIDRHFHIDPDTSAHDLLNAASEWLQYAHRLNRLLIDLVAESDGVAGERVADALETADALMSIGTRCVAQAHERMVWHQSRTMPDAQDS